VTDRRDCDDADERLARVALQRLGVPDARLTLLGCGLSSNAWLVSDNATDRDLVLRVALTDVSRNTYEREHTVLDRILDTLNQAETSALTTTATSRAGRPLPGKPASRFMPADTAQSLTAPAARSN